MSGLCQSMAALGRRQSSEEETAEETDLLLCTPTRVEPHQLWAEVLDWRVWGTGHLLREVSQID